MSEPLNIGLRLGAMEIGTMLSSVLLGVTTVQLYMYYTKNYQDPLWLRAFVLFIWLLEITLTSLNWEYLYHLTVTNYGKPPDLDRTPWTINIHTLFVGLSGSLVQMYFTYRLRALSRTLILPVLAWTGSALHLIGSIFTVAFLSRMSIDRLESQAYRWSIICTLIFDLFVDILNTVGLSMWLYAQKQQNDLPRMNHIVNKLIKWTVQTGLITSIAASLMLILYLALPDTYLWLSISWFYTKLYSNNLLALLNGRHSLRHSEVRPSFIGTPRPLEISVSTTTHTHQTETHSLKDLEEGVLNSKSLHFDATDSLSYSQQTQSAP